MTDQPVTDQVDERPGRISDAVDHSDLRPVVLAGVLVLAAVVVGAILIRSGVPVHAPAAPLFADVRLHAGPGTPLALAIAALVLAYGPGVARDWSWPAAVMTATLASLLWTVSLALVSGPDGILGPLATGHEYLADIPRVAAVPDLLSTFTASIPADAPQPWRTHTAGHPPGMLLFFVLLARVGLPGPGPAAIACLLAAALIVPCVAATTRRVCGPDWARRVLPFLVLLPAAVWAGVSADAVIAAVGAVGILLLAVAATTSRAPAVPATAGGVVLGLACFLSYGAILLAVPALALLIGLRRWRLVLPVAVGGLSVVALFALSGFVWWDGLTVLHGRYLAGYGGSRPLGYWLWANLAVLAIAAGPAVVAGLARLLSRNPAGRPATGFTGALALAGGALLAVLIASLSGMSKAEVERIWLPWIVWLPVACALLPGSRVRWWLAAQAAVALLLEHLLITPW